MGSDRTSLNNLGGRSLKPTMEAPQTAAYSQPLMGVMRSSSFGSQYSAHNEQNPKTEMKRWGNNGFSNPSVKNRFANTNSRNEFSPEPDMIMNHQYQDSSVRLQHNRFEIATITI